MPFDVAGHVDALQRVRDLDSLREVRRRIAERGMWCRGRMYGPGGSRCAQGWLREIAGYQAALRIEAQDIRLVLPEGYSDLASYNDSDSTTQDDLVSLLDKAIRALEVSS